MKRWIPLLLLAMSCSKTTNTDKRLSGAERKIFRSALMPDGRVWTTENLGIEIPGSYCPLDDALNCNEYGRLYTWEASNQACKALGAGWKLPTEEEWRALAKSCGGVFDDAPDHGRTAYQRLLLGGSAGFNARLGGNREASGSYERVGAHGFYWTASKSDSAQAWFYNFGKGSTLLNRHTGDKRQAFSVRCIQRIGN